MLRYLRRGALAGAAGGVLTALVLLLLGERSMSAAIALESAQDNGTADAPLFGRPEQLAGGVVAVLLSGLFMGLCFGVVFAAVRHRVGGDDWRRSLALAATGFGTLFLVPFLKYPPNPPAVGDPDTNGRRTALYLAAVAWSVVSTWGAWRLHRWLALRGAPAHLRQTGVVAAVVVLVGLGLALLPGTPDPVDAPATLIWRFRLASLAGAAAFWGGLGLAFGWLALLEAAGPRATAGGTSSPGTPRDRTDPARDRSPTA